MLFASRLQQQLAARLAMALRKAKKLWGPSVLALINVFKLLCVVRENQAMTSCEYNFMIDKLMFSYVRFTLHVNDRVIKCGIVAS